MNRLPRYDSGTCRGEFTAFLSLGLLATLLVLFAARDAGRFAQDRETIIEAFSNGPPSDYSIVGPATNHAITNLTLVPARGRGERAG